MTFRASSRIKRPRAAASSYLPTRVCQSYAFPRGVDATPQVIAVGELGGAPPSPADVQDWAQRVGLPTPSVQWVTLPGADTSSSEADGEVALDWQLAAAAYSFITGQAAKILLVYGPNSEQAFADAVDEAVKAGASAFSWSWGAPEDGWSAAGRQAHDAACVRAVVAGCPVFAASGDNDSNDGEQAPVTDYPAASPWVVGCGGTSLPPGGAETVWNNGQGEGTGGGFSRVYPRPSWQPASGQGGGRMVPDLAADADPATGYQVVVAGQWQVIGGTSAVAPLMAGYFAATQGARQKSGLLKLGALNAVIYANLPSFFDVQQGNNGAYRAEKGPDPCTGAGRVLGSTLFAALTQTSTGGGPPAPPPAPPPVSGNGGNGMGLTITMAQLKAIVDGTFATIEGVEKSALLRTITAAVNSVADANMDLIAMALGKAGITVTP